MDLEDHKDADDVERTKYYDKEFAARVKLISNSREVTRRFSRMSSNSGGKFCIGKTAEYEYADEEDKDAKDHDTYLDYIYNHLSDCNIPNTTISKLQQFMLTQAVLVN